MAGAGQHATPEVDAGEANFQQIRDGLVAHMAAQQGTDAGEEFLQTEGLEQVVVGPAGRGRAARSRPEGKAFPAGWAEMRNLTDCETLSRHPWTSMILLSVLNYRDANRMLRN